MSSRLCAGFYLSSKQAFRKVTTSFMQTRCGLSAGLRQGRQGRQTRPEAQQFVRAPHARAISVTMLVPGQKPPHQLMGSHHGDLTATRRAPEARGGWQPTGLLYTLRTSALLGSPTREQERKGANAPHTGRRLRSQPRPEAPAQSPSPRNRRSPG